MSDALSKTNFSAENFDLQVEGALSRALEAKQKRVDVIGSGDGTTLAALLSSNISSLSHFSHVVLLSDADLAEEFANDLSFFNSTKKALTLPSFDVSPYSGLYPNPKIVASRIGWYGGVLNALPGEIFVATAESFLQKSMPVTALKEFSLRLEYGSEVPKDLNAKLESLGYYPASLVEDVGSFAVRGGIVDIFSPAHQYPIRMELFGDLIDSIRFFNPETQRSLDPTDKIIITPAREINFSDQAISLAAKGFRTDSEARGLKKDLYDSQLRQLVRGQTFNGMDFLLPYFYENLSLPLNFIGSNTLLWFVDPIDVARNADALYARLKSEYENSKEAISPKPNDLYFMDGIDGIAAMASQNGITAINLSKILLGDIDAGDSINHIRYASQTFIPSKKGAQERPLSEQEKLLVDLRHQGNKVFISSTNPVKTKRLLAQFTDTTVKLQLTAPHEFLWQQWFHEQTGNSNLIHLIERPISKHFNFADDKIVILDDSFFFGSKKFRSPEKEVNETLDKVKALSFADLKIGDLVVHSEHGVGFFDGLQKISIQGLESEFIALRYKDNDKLYLPAYRVGQIQKYSGPTSEHLLDKLGTGQWQATKIKVKNKLRDVAADLLQLYAARNQVERPSFGSPDDDYLKFENEFPYEETKDQTRAINDILNDMQKIRPMDRLICGDVGFGKTEVAMRAAFKAVQSKRLVIVLAPTTVLTFQHFENFKKRFAHWPIEIRLLNRFISKGDSDKTLKDLAAGKVDVVIGTHRLLSKDVQLPNLGLIVIDEEHKFGVIHKEKLRKLSVSVDTLALSATPIPRTLNMSLVGIRDISIINTAPIDRMPIRTFICKFDEETIAKAIHSELTRGGQVFFIHNRIQSIYDLGNRLRQIVPDLRMTIAHGQMDTKQLEEAIVSFFKKEIDVLLCTTIVESGMDIPNANTMFIDRADTFGLSQLYQLRGRIGRSKTRAYCYLLLPDSGNIDKEAQERLKVIQENVALGSGFKIAHYDLELRGAGNILGEDQSGHISAVGFELYYELLEEALKSARGEELSTPLPDPEINVRIPALIPDSYIPDIRLRLAYYKSFSQIRHQDDIDNIEEELRDQFGALPEEVVNLMGLMLIRSLCKQLAIRDLSSGVKSISLAFTERTPLPADVIIKLSALPNKKYSFTKDGRLIVRMNDITWPNIFTELEFLIKQCPKTRT